MKLFEAKQTISIIKKMIDENYFSDKEMIETQISNRDLAIKNGQESAKQYTDEIIKRYCLRKSLRLSFYNTANQLHGAIQSANFDYLKGRVRYDQKLTRTLFELYTGAKVPKTNKETVLFLKNMFD